MATLVLTAVGTVVGGPVGGAIGALLGRSVDGALLRGGRREGPRLTELAVQTSSYGSQIPKLFGTMRVAGTVIWATDLIESRSTSRRGKGQPSVSTYSYAASFAVLLSARPIAGVGRIWAEGKLLRGAGGDFKTGTGFRLHLGGEDQAADPLIASAEGLAACPAYRGCAYAVFEGMQLADYGNRIPSLTFEVIADAGPVRVAAIARDLAPEVTGDAAFAVDGFAAAGGSVRAVLETLGQAGGIWFAAEGAAVALREAGGAATPVADAGVSAEGGRQRGARRARAVAAIDTVPRTITLGYYDAARDYQAGLQRARRPGAGTRDERRELPAVLSAGAAKTVAEAMLARAEGERTRRTVTLAFEGLAAVPGTLVAVADEPGAWRIAESLIEGMTTRLTLVPVEPAPAAAQASGGRVLGAADVASGATRVVAFETPALDDVPLSAPRLSVAANGTGAGWRQAALLYSIDDGASWTAAGATAAPAMMGAVESAAEDAFVVALARPDMDLVDADTRALDGGANLAIIGDELVQFGAAEPLGEARWRLTGLRRGRRGTEAATGTQAPGDRFVVIEGDAVRGIDLPVAALGRTVRVLASGVGDGEPVEARCVLHGASVLPPAPVALTVELQPSGDALLTWVRRSRAGWRWSDGATVPLGEETEAYRVTIRDASGTERHAEVATPTILIAFAERQQGPLEVSVRQRGTFGESLPARIEVARSGRG